MSKTGTSSAARALDRPGWLILWGVVLSCQDLTVFMGCFLAPSEEYHHPDNEDDKGNDKEGEHKPCSPLAYSGVYVCVCVSWGGGGRG